MKDSNEYIIGLGSVAIDNIGKVDALPKEDGFCMVTEQQALDGGSCANVMTQVARLGAPAALVARIGDDDNGRKIRKGLEHYNVNTSWLMTKQGGTSLTTQIFVDPKGAKTIVLYMGDSLMSVELSDLDLSLLDHCKVLYTDLFPPRTAVAAARAAKGKGKPVVFNMQVGWPLMQAFGTDRDLMREMLKYTDVFAPCRSGAFELAGVDKPLDCIRKLRAEFDFKGIFILTLGEEGSLIEQDGKLTEIPVYHVDGVDTTGAGDSYIGAFMYAYYCAGFDLGTAGRFAAASAALTCTRIGARSTPTLQEVNAFGKWR